MIVGGALITAGGIYWLSRVPVHGTYAADVLPGLLTMPLGARRRVRRRHHRRQRRRPGRPGRSRGRAAQRRQQVGSALGLAIFSAIATSRTQHLLAAHAPRADALTSGYQRALLVSSIFVLAAAIIALRSSDTRQTATTPPIPVELATDPATQ